MTWKFVTMWPAESHTMPDPEPCGISSTFIEKKSCVARKVLMNTTEGMFSRKSLP